MLEMRENKTNIEISGEKYTLVGGSSPEQMSQIAGYINSIMRHLAERNPKLGKTHVAVLAALNAADELFKLKEEYNNIVGMLEPEENQIKSSKKRYKY
ncbi:MAG: cell division protein ZapA [Peptococcaceae bacterium]|nr:cell division protein ZapA [Peptococcaceae bacterium]